MSEAWTLSREPDGVFAKDRRGRAKTLRFLTFARRTRFTMKTVAAPVIATAAQTGPKRPIVAAAAAPRW